MGQLRLLRRTRGATRRGPTLLRDRSTGRITVTTKRKPERADVCIIGAGASGATAAKVLTERGLRVVALERGPWRGKETVVGDELANISRYNLWPDPLLNPGTVVRPESGSTEPVEELFCPVAQMVG